MMSEVLSWMFFVMTVGFIFYWLISYCFLKIGFYFNVSAVGIEFFRLWLKPLFILNFSWFVIIEIVFSLVYWTTFILLKILPFGSPAILFVNGLHSDDPAVMSWLIISIIIYCLVMAPYFFLQHKLSFYFKRTIFTKITKSINAKSSKFHGQSAKLKLDQNLYTQLAAKDETIKEWIKNSIENHDSNPGDEDKRFSISNIATDHMSWEINNISVEFYEAEIAFDGTIKKIDSKGNNSYKSTLTKELFDGIVIVVKDMFEEPWKPNLFETERLFIGKEKKNRIIHKQSFLMSLYNDIVFKTISTKTPAAYNDSKIEQYNKPEKLKIQTESLFQFIFCDKKDLYLFLKTDLDGTAFDLNMNISVNKSIELFKQDLSLVESAMGEIKEIIQFIEENNIKYGKDVA
jgi:hypothetical protein